MDGHLSTQHKKRTMQLLLSRTWQITKNSKKRKNEREKKKNLQQEKRGQVELLEAVAEDQRAWGDAADALPISQWLRRPDSGGEVLAVGYNPVFIFRSRLRSRRSDISHKTAWMMRMALLMSALNVAVVYAREQDMNGNCCRKVIRNMDVEWIITEDIECNFLIH